MRLTEEQLRFFAEHGYVHVPSVISAERVAAALAVSDAAYTVGKYGTNANNRRDCVPEFGDETAKDHAITDIFNKSDLTPMCEQILGKGNVHRVGRAQVAYREPNPILKKEGYRINDMVKPDSWHIDVGKRTADKESICCSRFTLLVGVALSEGQEVDENRGQFVAWPKSHCVLHEMVSKEVKAGIIKEGVWPFAGKKPDIGAPIRALLKSGDAIIAHQRLAHAGGPNVGAHVRKNLYFRVKHKRHKENIQSDAIINGSVFVECEGIDEIAAAFV